MRLSEAIRLGAMMMPQSYWFFERDREGNYCACCAFGAAVWNWTRERIADWVATIEPAEVATEQPKEVPHDLEMV